MGHPKPRFVSLVIPQVSKSIRVVQGCCAYFFPAVWTLLLEVLNRPCERKIATAAASSERRANIRRCGCIRDSGYKRPCQTALKVNHCSVSSTLLQQRFHYYTRHTLATHSFAYNHHAVPHHRVHCSLHSHHHRFRVSRRRGEAFVPQRPCTSFTSAGLS